MEKSNNCNPFHLQKANKWEYFSAQSPGKLLPCIQPVTLSKISILAFVIITATVSRIPLRSDEWQLQDELEAQGRYHTWRFIPITALDFPNSVPCSRHRLLLRNTTLRSFWRGTALNGLQYNTRNKMPHSGDVIAFYLVFMYLLCRDRGIVCMAIFLLPVQSPLQN